MKYYEQTKGSFHPLPFVISEPVDELQINRHRFFLDYVSTWYDTWEEKEHVGSIYWLSEDGKYLIRSSDHWSHSRPKYGWKVGKIRKCYWTLAKGKKIMAANGKIAAIIRLSDLTVNK